MLRLTVGDAYLFRSIARERKDLMDYNSSYSRIWIGSRLWFIGGKMHECEISFFFFVAVSYVKL